MKYIVYQMDGFQVPVLFPDHITHSTVHVLNEPGHTVKPIAAGFFAIDSNRNVTCTGRSESMKLPSRGPKDAELIKDHIVTGLPIQYQLLKA